MTSEVSSGLYVLAGALFGFEMLCLILGRIFEPYIVNILPHLLLCFGDNSNFVRQVRADEHHQCSAPTIPQLIT